MWAIWKNRGILKFPSEYWTQYKEEINHSSGGFQHSQEGAMTFFFLFFLTCQTIGNINIHQIKNEKKCTILQCWKPLESKLKIQLLLSVKRVDIKFADTHDSLCVKLTTQRSVKTPGAKYQGPGFLLEEVYTFKKNNTRNILACIMTLHPFCK